jgi:hypothetical protein
MKLFMKNILQGHCNRIIKIMEISAIRSYFYLTSKIKKERKKKYRQKFKRKHKKKKNLSHR